MPLIDRLFALSPAEVSFTRRGFPDDGNGVRAHLERVGTAFVDGYNAALRHGEVDTLAAALGTLPHDLHGFAHEGAAMALGIFDLLTPWKRTRCRALLQRAPQHVYLCVVGMGWSLARMRVRRIPRFVQHAFPVLAPLAADGFGFHEAFFKPAAFVHAAAPSPLPAPHAHGFDQGVGRGLWFVCGANPARIQTAIAGFASHRHADLWSGCGLALAYAGGVGVASAAELLDRSGPHRSSVAQGIAFAAKARVLAGNVTAFTELACTLAWNRAARETAAFVDDAFARTEGEAYESRYEMWRNRIKNSFIVSY